MDVTAGGDGLPFLGDGDGDADGEGEAAGAAEAFGMGVATTGAGVGGSTVLGSAVAIGCGVAWVTRGVVADGSVVGAGEACATLAPGIFGRKRHAAYPPAMRTRSATIPMPA